MRRDKKHQITRKCTERWRENRKTKRIIILEHNLHLLRWKSAIQGLKELLRLCLKLIIQALWWELCQTFILWIQLKFSLQRPFITRFLRVNCLKPSPKSITWASVRASSRQSMIQSCFQTQKHHSTTLRSLNRISCYFRSLSLLMAKDEKKQWRLPTDQNHLLLYTGWLKRM